MKNPKKTRIFRVFYIVNRVVLDLKSYIIQIGS